ncbi:hypothetical protein ACOME3_000573 [Neoechinorhynchus agilis]
MTSTTLPYEKDLLLRLYQENSLVIMARGLGVDRIFLNLLRMYSDPKYMVICLNLNKAEQDHFITELSYTNSNRLPRIINTDTPVNKRVEVYSKGGIFFITSRILTVDLLTSKIPVNNISGILIYQAHRIAENCQEAFIMNLYREKNKTGFIKALSDNPLVFTKSLCRVSISMKMLFVRSLILLPRFDASVQQYLSKKEADVIEIHVDMSDRMKKIQISLFEIINSCLQELRRNNKFFDNDMLTLDNAILPYFQNYIRNRLSEVWAQVDAKNRQLVNELRILQNLILGLTQTDPISFYAMVQSVRMNETKIGRNSNWIVLEAADVLFNEARARVFGTNLKESNKPDIQSCIDENPKLNAILDVIEEIKRTKLDNGIEPVTLIVAWEEKSCVNIKEFLRSCSVEEYIREQLEALSSILTVQDDLDVLKNKRRTAGTSTTTNLIVAKTLLDQFLLNENPAESRETPINYDIDDPPCVICPLTGIPDTFAITRLLYKYKPRFIVLFDTMLPFIRQIEVFNATHPDHDLTVFSMGYVDSAEERIFLSTVDIEQRAMSDLIEDSKTLVVPEDVEGLMENDIRFRRDDTRILLGDRSELGRLESKKKRARLYENEENNESEEPKHRVIVDMREFRSELPALLYRRGIEIVPTTLEVGDYIITPDMCIERKSISDLCQSLNNGQSLKMIEFNQNTDFGIKQRFNKDNNFTSRETYSKLALLTLHFPKLRILWCPTPKSSAEMIHELKLNRDQPNLEQAMAIRNDMSVDETKYSELCQDLLLRVPGISFKNCRKVMDHVDSFMDMADLNLERLTEILENAKSANQIYAFFNTRIPKK